MHTVTLGDLDLTTGGYGITSFDARNPGLLRLRLDIEGTDEDDLIDKIRAIRTQINRATVGAQPASGSPWVTLAMQARESSLLVEYLVRAGSVDPPVIADRSMYEFELGWLGRVDVELECLPETLGPEIEYGPFAVTGASPTLHIDGIPGDMPALAELRITDQSPNGSVVNRLRWACRSLPVMTDGDFVPVLPLIASGSGASEEDVDTFSGTFARLNATPTWATIGHVSGSAGEYTSGLFDVWGRVRDASTPLDTPQINTATVTPGPTLLQTKSINGNSPGASKELSFDLPTTPGSHLLLKIFISRGTVSALAETDWVQAVVSSGEPKSYLYYIENSVSRTGSGVIQFTSNPTYAIALEEWTGLAASGSLDKTASNTETASTSHSTGATDTTTQAYELWVANFAKDFDGRWLGYPSGWTRTLLAYNTYYMSYYRIVTAVAAAEAIQPSMDAIDTSNLIATFKLAAASPPALPPGSYTYWVTAYDSVTGIESAASSPFAISLAVTSGVLLTWTAPGNGDYTSFRIYWKKDAANIAYIDTGSTDTTYLHDSETSTATADPPTTPLTTGQFRLGIGPQSGITIDVYSPPAEVVTAFGNWEPVYFGRAYLPASATPLSASAPGFRLAVQGKQATQSVELDVDTLVLLPADEQQMDARYTAGDLATLGEWVIGTTPDMRSYGFLRSTVDASEQGRLKTLGYALLGPGDTTLVPLPTVVGGVWNVADISLSVTVILRPRYAWLAGGV